MADTKITALDAIGANPINVATFPIPMVDLLDNSMAASGTTKKVTVNQILGAGGTATLASATITGDLTVDTNVLKVDTTNNRVTVGTTSAYGRLTVGVGSGLQAGTTTNVASGLYDIDYATTGNINTRFSFVNSNGVTNAAIDRIGNPNVNDSGNLAFLTRSGAGSLTERYRIAADGVATWSEVGGVAGTAMTLDATGLGVGIVPSGGAKLAIRDSGSNDSYIGLGANNDIYLSTGASGVHYFRKGGAAASMTLDAPGNLLVGTATPNFTNTNGFVVAQPTDATYISVGHVTGTATGAYYCSFGFNGTQIGSITQNGTTGVLYNINSDYRLKESVAPLSGGLDRVNALKPSIYKWKSDGSSGEGFLAHELAEVVPFAVTGEKDAVNEDGTMKTQSIDMSRVVPILVAAIQELTARVQTLEAK